ncbi:MAG: DUF2075 domain-containing protein [Candidatus Thermoplasmatota archaeon]|nr:DUF2075 domain-containing protein [Candidatus Thermoplasmatota archaeon]
MENSLYETNSFPSAKKDEILETLSRNYRDHFGTTPRIEETNSWKASLDFLAGTIPSSVPVIMEYIFPLGLQRADLILLGHRIAHVVEIKGWASYREVDEYTCDTDLGEHIQPCYQLNDYLSKFRNFHSASRDFTFSGSVLMYNTRDGKSCDLIYNRQEFEDRLGALIRAPAQKGDIDLITGGKFIFSDTLVNFLKGHVGEMLKQPTKALVSSGFGFSENQMLIFQKILRSIGGRRRVFLVKGRIGTGKTLLAVSILFNAISANKYGFLTYRNNRLIYTLRRAFGIASEFLKFYSMGPRGNFMGVAEKNFRTDDLERPPDFMIYDEAQRMTRENIRIGMTRAPITVFFFDEDQILNGMEEGTETNFADTAKSMGLEYETMEMTSTFRMRFGDRVDRFIESIWSEPLLPPPDGYLFRIESSMDELIRDLSDFMNERKKVALLASWTESSGKEGDKIRVRNPRIEWLMDPSTEYPSYWIDQKDALTKCASVYGSQGFEADYAGFIWGKDLVWRGKWDVIPENIYDNMGGRQSLQSVAKRDREKARELLINRANILLSRGIMGTLVYFEDEETGKHLKSLLSAARSPHT